MKTKIVSLIEIIILIIVTVGLSTFIEPCNGDMVMKCNHSANVVKLLLATGILVKVIGLFVKAEAHVYFDLFAVLLYIDTILVPAWLVEGCKMADMACRQVTFPSIYVVSILLIVINGVSILFHLLKKRGKDEV